MHFLLISNYFLNHVRNLPSVENFSWKFSPFNFSIESFSRMKFQHGQFFHKENPPGKRSPLTISTPLKISLGIFDEYLHMKNRIGKEKVNQIKIILYKNSSILPLVLSSPEVKYLTFQLCWLKWLFQNSDRITLGKRSMEGRRESSCPPIVSVMKWGTRTVIFVRNFRIFMSTSCRYFWDPCYKTSTTWVDQFSWN